MSLSCCSITLWDVNVQTYKKKMIFKEIMALNVLFLCHD